MSESSLKDLLKIFSFQKKSDLEKYCRDLTICFDDFVALVFACESSGQTFLHEISFRDKVPPHLVPSESEIAALKNSPAGTFLTGDASKAVRKMSQSFVDRRYLVGHMFFTPDRSRWHFFCFDQRDLETEGNHWEKGSHVHFVNWLWPRLDAKSVWSHFVTDDARPGGDIHLRFVGTERENGMKIKQCEFSGPVEKRSSSGIHHGMFDEDVHFRFEVKIDGTKRKDIEEMLKLFEKSSTDFKETWRKKLADLAQ